MQKASQFFLYLSYKDTLGYPRSMVLGPWSSVQAASDYSDNLTDSRIGEQILKHLGVEKIVVQES